VLLLGSKAGYFIRPIIYTHYAAEVGE